MSLGVGEGTRGMLWCTKKSSKSFFLSGAASYAEYTSFAKPCEAFSKTFFASAKTSLGPFLLIQGVHLRAIIFRSISMLLSGGCSRGYSEGVTGGF